MPSKTTCIGAFPKPGETAPAHWRQTEVDTGAVRKYQLLRQTMLSVPLIVHLNSMLGREITSAA